LAHTVVGSSDTLCLMHIAAAWRMQPTSDSAFYQITLVLAEMSYGGLVYWLTWWSWSTKLLYTRPGYYLDGWLSADR